MHLKTLEKELLSRSLPERIQFISSYFAGERLVFSTSFGQEDQAITQAIASTKSPIDIFTLDTGRQFQESYELMDLTIKKYGIPLKTFFPSTPAVEKLVEKSETDKVEKTAPVVDIAPAHTPETVTAMPSAVVTPSAAPTVNEATPPTKAEGAPMEGQSVTEAE